MPNAIRHALTADIAACLHISNASAQVHHANFAIEPESPQDWQDDFDQHTPHFPWFVSTTDGDVTGFARAMPWRRRDGYLHTAEVSVYIDPASRGKGLGRGLYAALLTALRTEGFHMLMACIALPNEPSVALHEAFGFTHAGTFHEVGRKFDQWWDVSYWELSLDCA